MASRADAGEYAREEVVSSHKPPRVRLCAAFHGALGGGAGFRPCRRRGSGKEPQMAVRKDQRSQSSPVAAWLRDAVEKDPALGRMLEQLERVAGSDEAAVLVGPRGCGLERAARGAHFLSRRASEAVLSVG